MGTNKKILLIVSCVIVIACVEIALKVFSTSQKTADMPAATIQPEQSDSSVRTGTKLPFSPPDATTQPTVSQQPVEWFLDKGNVWSVKGTPPQCPDPLVFNMPVDENKVTAILYPGQPRGEAWKPHGGFRFDKQTNNKIDVRVPFDAVITRGSRAFRSGENQYFFEFTAPCGIMYTIGHLLELSPKYLAIANTLPLIDDDKDGFHTQQIFDIDPPVSVTKGDLIATAVGYAKQHSTFMDFGAFDLRHQNGSTLRSEWAKYSTDFDHYAICWLDLLPASDRDHLIGLFGSGDSVTGTKSDYCHYPPNK